MSWSVTALGRVAFKTCATEDNKELELSLCCSEFGLIHLITGMTTREHLEFKHQPQIVLHQILLVLHSIFLATQQKVFSGFTTRKVLNMYEPLVLTMDCN